MRFSGVGALPIPASESGEAMQAPFVGAPLAAPYLLAAPCLLAALLCRQAFTILRKRSNRPIAGLQQHELKTPHNSLPALATGGGNG